MIVLGRAFDADGNMHRPSHGLALQELCSGTPKLRWLRHFGHINCPRAAEIRGRRGTSWPLAERKIFHSLSPRTYDLKRSQRARLWKRFWGTCTEKAAALLLSPATLVLNSEDSQKTRFIRNDKAFVFGACTPLATLARLSRVCIWRCGERLRGPIALHNAGVIASHVNMITINMTVTAGC